VDTELTAAGGCWSIMFGMVVADSRWSSNDGSMMMEVACFTSRDLRDRGRRCSGPELLGVALHVIRPGAGGGVCVVQGVR
jgi:hypothetical protein